MRLNDTKHHYTGRYSSTYSKEKLIEDYNDIAKEEEYWCRWMDAQDILQENKGRDETQLFINRYKDEE